MDNRFIGLTIVSARDLKSVTFFGKNQPFAVAYVDRMHKCTTHVAADGGCNPIWNEKHQVPVSASTLQRGDAVLTIEIYSRGALRHKTIGTVHIPIEDIIIDGKDRATKFVTYQVQRPSGKVCGSLSVIAKMTEETGRSIQKEIGCPEVKSGVTSHDDLVVAYPAYGSAINSSQLHPRSYAYPIPQYPPPPVTSYPPRYHPPQYPAYYPPNPYQSYPEGSYYSPAEVPQKLARNQFGNGGPGIGAGMLGGAVGGLLLGELVSDMSYNAGYDQGFGAGLDGGDWGVGF